VASQTRVLFITQKIGRCHWLTQNTSALEINETIEQSADLAVRIRSTGFSSKSESLWRIFIKVKFSACKP
ncbi:MAG: hypothetical protein ACRC4N_03155, partial [Gammaproteobacteria bacterium]